MLPWNWYHFLVPCSTVQGRSSSREPQFATGRTFVFECALSSRKPLDWRPSASGGSCPGTKMRTISRFHSTFQCFWLTLCLKLFNRSRLSQYANGILTWLQGPISQHSAIRFDVFQLLCLFSPFFIEIIQGFLHTHYLRHILLKEVKFCFSAWPRAAIHFYHDFSEPESWGYCHSWTAIAWLSRKHGIPSLHLFSTSYGVILVTFKGR